MPVEQIDDNVLSRITYENWRATGRHAGLEYMGTVHQPLSIGATATFQFEGTGVEVFGSIPNLDTKNGQESSKASYKIDDTPAREIPTNGGFSAQWQQSFFSANGLSNGPHTLVITYTGGADYFLDYLKVTTPEPSPAPEGNPTGGNSGQDKPPPSQEEEEEEQSPPPAHNNSNVASLPRSSSTSSTRVTGEVTSPSPTSHDITSPASSTTSSNAGSFKTSVTSTTGAPVSSHRSEPTQLAGSDDNTQSSQGSATRPNVGAIVGGVVGGVVLFLLLALVLYRRRKRLRSFADDDSSIHSVPRSVTFSPTVPRPFVNYSRPPIVDRKAPSPSWQDTSSQAISRPNTSGSQLSYDSGPDDIPDIPPPNYHAQV